MQVATAVFEKARAAIAGVVTLAVSGLSAIGSRLTSAFSAIRSGSSASSRRSSPRQKRRQPDRACAGRQRQGNPESLCQGTTRGGGSLEKAFHAVVDKVRAVVAGAINFAKGALAAFGTSSC